MKKAPRKPKPLKCSGLVSRGGTLRAGGMRPNQARRLAAWLTRYAEWREYQDRKGGR